MQVRSQININFHAASSVKLYHLIKVPDTHKFYSWQGSPAQKRSTKVQLINYSLITRGHTRDGGMVQVGGEGVGNCGGKGSKGFSGKVERRLGKRLCIRVYVCVSISASVYVCVCVCACMYTHVCRSSRS